jgi:hypothetical protein
MPEPMLLAATRSARRLFPEVGKGEVSVQHNPGSRDLPMLARQWLLQKTEISPEFIDLAFSEESRWQYAPFPETDLYGLSFAKARQHLKQHLRPLYELASASLDGIDERGFNRHDEIHIGHVDHCSQELLSLAENFWNELAGQRPGFIRPIDDQAKKRTLIAAWGHDLGNVVSRKYHPLVSNRILPYLYPSLLADPPQWRLIRRAITVHHELFAEHLRKELARANPDYQVEDLLDFLRHRFGPEALALIIADKTDLGRHRISRKGCRNVMIDDPHLELNLLGKTDGLRLEPDGTELVWNLTFDIRIGAEETELVPLSQERHHSPGRKARVSLLTHALFEDQSVKVTYFDVWRMQFWKQYIERNFLAISAMFALFPKLERVRLAFSDPEVGQSATQVIKKEHLMNDFRRLRVFFQSNGNGNGNGHGSR